MGIAAGIKGLAVATKGIAAGKNSIAAVTEPSPFVAKPGGLSNAGMHEWTRVSRLEAITEFLVTFQDCGGSSCLFIATETQRRRAANNKNSLAKHQPSPPR
jgi:hypothetical protein